jgi:hypothetical protein
MKGSANDGRPNYTAQLLTIHQGRYGACGEGVSIVTSTNKLRQMENIFANYDRQQYEKKELVVVLNNNLLNIDEWREETRKHPAVTVYQLDETKSLSECLNFGVDKARFECIAKFDDDDYYAPAYTEDMMYAFRYSGADVVGKHSYHVYVEKSRVLAIRFPGREHRFVEYVAGPTLVFDRRVFDKVRFGAGKGEGGDTRFLKDSLTAGFTVYSADRFNFVLVRRGSKDLHTWKIADDELLAGSRIVAYTDDYVPLVTC